MRSSIAVVAVILVLLLASCGGASLPPGNNPGGNNPPPPVNGTVSGTLDLSGIPVSGLNGAPGDVTRSSLKVIDPGEEIGNTLVTAPQPGGSFTIANVKTGTVKYLNIGFTTPVDLKGIQVNSTPLSLNIPIQVAAGAGTVLHTKVSLFGAMTPASLRRTSQTSGQSVEVEYDYAGPDGTRHVKFVIDFRLTQTTFDDNGNGTFTDDTGHNDSNLDGISDDRGLEDAGSGQWVEVEQTGAITASDAGSITVNGVVFTLDDRTSYEDGASRSDLSVGAIVEVKGYTTESGITYADEVKVDSSGDGGGGTSGIGGGSGDGGGGSDGSGTSGGSGDGGSGSDGGGTSGGSGDGGSGSDGGGA